MPAQPLPAAVVTARGVVDRDALEARVADVAGGLLARGIAAGDRVVLVGTNTYEYVVVHLALDRIGAVTVNLPAGIRRDANAIAVAAGAKLCAVEGADDAAVITGAHEVIALDPDGVGALAESGPPATPVARDPAAPTWLAFTSGSTGTPRGALHTRASLDASTAAMAERYRLGPRDPILVAAPIGHGIGFTYGVRLAADLGAPLVLLQRWDAERAVAAIVAERCAFAAVPTPFLADLVELGRKVEAELRHLLVGGAPVPREQVVEADSLFGHGVVSGYFGSSETGATTSSPPGTSDDDRLDSDGCPLPRMEVAIVDDLGRPVAEGEEGTMLVRGPQVARGYWGGVDRDGQFRADGWFDTGDRAVRRPSGFVKIAGRAKSLIIRGAVNISPRSVEEAIVRHPRISRAVVLGVPDSRLGERVAAVITPRGEAPDREELREWLRATGAPRTAYPDLVFAVEDLPRGPTGKVDVRGLHATVLAASVEGA